MRWTSPLACLGGLALACALASSGCTTLLWSESCESKARRRNAAERAPAALLALRVGALSAAGVTLTARATLASGEVWDWDGPADSLYHPPSRPVEPDSPPLSGGLPVLFLPSDPADGSAHFDRSAVTIGAEVVRLGADRSALGGPVERLTPEDARRAVLVFSRCRWMDVNYLDVLVCAPTAAGRRLTPDGKAVILTEDRARDVTLSGPPRGVMREDVLFWCVVPLAAVIDVAFFPVTVPIYFFARAWEKPMS